MGTGIFSMHYIGMTALHASVHMEHAPAYVAASWVITQLQHQDWRFGWRPGRIGRPPIILSAVAFGIAVSRMHYTAMAGMTPFPMAMSSSGAPALSTDCLAIVVAVVAFCVSGIFLLVLVPERAREQGVAPAIATYPDCLLLRSLQAAEMAIKRNSAGEPMRRSEVAGGPPPRIAHHLPVEHDGATHFIAVEDVVAVHANAHYTCMYSTAPSNCFAPGYRRSQIAARQKPVYSRPPQPRYQHRPSDRTSAKRR